MNHLLLRPRQYTEKFWFIAAGMTARALALALALAQAQASILIERQFPAPSEMDFVQGGGEAGRSRGELLAPPSSGIDHDQAGPIGSAAGGLT